MGLDNLYLSLFVIVNPTMRPDSWESSSRSSWPCSHLASSHCWPQWDYFWQHVRCSWEVTCVTVKLKNTNQTFLVHFLVAQSRATQRRGGFLFLQKKERIKKKLGKMVVLKLGKTDYVLPMCLVHPACWWSSGQVVQGKMKTEDTERFSRKCIFKSSLPL